MRKSLIYTGGGDGGLTSLVGGRRVPKSDVRIDAYGNIDELNSFIGLLLTAVERAEVIEILTFVQHKLFVVGSMLATDPADRREGAAQITLSDVERLERCIDLLDSELPRMRGFVLPGGNYSSSLSHVCRTVCRRAERGIHVLSLESEVDEKLKVFVNRLSDLLFVIGRQESLVDGGEEFFWDNSV
jgi:cob(I)alamin adenosyltransferase